MLKVCVEVGVKWLLLLNLKKGDCVVLIVEISSGFVEVFFVCQYVGLVVVLLVILMGVGQWDFWSVKLQGLLVSCQFVVIIIGDEWLLLVNVVMYDNFELYVLSYVWFKVLLEVDVVFQCLVLNDIVYFQYIFGSICFFCGVIIIYCEVMVNLCVISYDGIKLCSGDCCVFWLFFYYDMGLVGFFLIFVVMQFLVDYLCIQDFVMCFL